MSRIGKMPIAVPAGVTMEFKDGVVTVKGPTGTLSREGVGNLDIVTEEGNIVLKRWTTAPTPTRSTAFTGRCSPAW